MNLLKNWEHIQSRYDEFWAMQNNDRPLMFVTSPKNGSDYSKAPKLPEDLTARWMAFDKVIAKNRWTLENSYYTGEGFPYFMPNLGPDIFGAILGCELVFGEDTSWAKHFVADWAECESFKLDKRGKWYKALSEFTDMAVADSRGDYIVGVTDLHPGVDALVSLRGPEDLCMDLYDCPEMIMPLPEKIWPVMKELYLDQVKRTSCGISGTVTWLPCYHRKNWYVLSCDFMCLISTGFFEAFALPELLTEMEFFDANLFHLDGPGALRHIDRLLEIPALGGIQWVSGSGAARESEWTDLLVKVQRAGKRLQLNVAPNDIERLAGFLKPEGVLLSVYCGCEDEANYVVRLADSLQWGALQHLV